MFDRVVDVHTLGHPKTDFLFQFVYGVLSDFSDHLLRRSFTWLELKCLSQLDLRIVHLSRAYI